jgi:hypothetical protein
MPLRKPLPPRTDTKVPIFALDLNASLDGNPFFLTREDSVVREADQFACNVGRVWSAPGGIEDFRTWNWL